MVEQALIDRIVARVLALLSGDPVDASRRNVLMLFSGASTGFVVGMEAVSYTHLDVYKRQTLRYRRC